MKKFKSFYEEMTFKVEVEGLPALFMSGNSPGQVKNHLRKLIKQPSMIKSVERKTKHDVKKMYRAKAQGKEVDENFVAEVLDTPEKRKEYIKKASQSNYSAAQKFARVAASPTGRKYKNKEMDKQDDIMRKRKAGLAMADRKTKDEAVDNPYAVGMAQAMKSTGDKPPLKKSTITKAHDIAKSIQKDESLDERTPVRPTVQHPKLKNLRVPNPKYKGFINRKKDNERSMDKFREGTMGDKPEWGTPEATRKAKKVTPGETCENNCGCDKCTRKMNEKLTIGKIRRAAYKTGKVLGDVQAVKKGKVARRVKNRILGKMVGKALSGLWK